MLLSGGVVYRPNARFTVKRVGKEFACVCVVFSLLLLLFSWMLADTLLWLHACA